MTVKELREMLEGFDDDLEVTVANNRQQNLLVIIEISYVSERNAMVIYTGGVHAD